VTTTTSTEPEGERPPIRLAVLDLAGTLVSDDGTVRHAFEDALAALGIRVTDDHRRVVDETMGQSKVEVFRRLLGNDDLASQAAAAFEAAYERRIPGTAPLPGAEDALAWLGAARIKVCLTTGFSERTRSALLAHLGWTRYPALSPGPHVRGRPAPDLVLTALMSAGIDDVREVAAVGDTVNDLLAGWRAGAGMVVGVLSGAHNRATLAGAPHTHLLASVADLPDAIAMHSG
jgi:phosphonatase-like hydrolase